jgi:hypothetical protein
MGRLTSEERRRVFLAQERNCQTMLARMSVAPAVDITHQRPWWRRFRSGSRRVASNREV